jgi:hypothetical protein
LEAKRRLLRKDHVTEADLRFHTLNLLDDILVGGSPITTVATQFLQMIKVSNEIVSFVLDDNTHFGTGMLVGPAAVLTAAHLFFEDDGALIDRRRLSRITAEAHTTLIGDHVIIEGQRSTSYLCNPCSNDWLIDPQIDDDDYALRDVDGLDFAIVRLDKLLGNETVGKEKRGWFVIPTVASAPVLAPYTMIRVFEFLDRTDLLTSSGFIRSIEQCGLRVLHTASTADSASGAPMLDDEFQLLAMHLAGAESGKWPRSNRGLPIRRVAEIIDCPLPDGLTIRAKLKDLCPDTDSNQPSSDAIFRFGGSSPPSAR